MTDGAGEARKAVKTGVRAGGGPPPGYRWNVDVLDAAHVEAAAFLDGLQRRHLAREVRALAMLDDPSHSPTVDVRPVEDFFEVRSKGGPLRRLNVRVFFHLHKPTRTLVVLSTIHKQNDGPTPMVDKIRVRRRRREYLESLPPAPGAPNEKEA